jgi:hypothetical protein
MFSAAWKMLKDTVLARLELQPLAFCCVSPTPQLKHELSLRPEFGWIRGNLQDFSKR